MVVVGIALVVTITVVSISVDVGCVVAEVDGCLGVEADVTGVPWPQFRHVFSHKTCTNISLHRLRKSIAQFPLY